MISAIPLAKGGPPLSRQIHLRLRAAVLEGAIRPGEALPSTRKLADQLRVSRTVILLAYDQLMAEGFVQGRHGSGTYVSELLGAGQSKGRERAAAVSLTRFGEAAVVAAPRLNFPPPRAQQLRYDFAYSRGAVSEFPFETWRRMLARRARGVSHLAFDYGPPAGSLALRQAIAAHLRWSRAVVCDASQVLIVNGSQQALDLAARVLLEPGDSVAIEDPHYQGAREIFRAAGAHLHSVPVDAGGLIPERLPRHARLAYVTPSHQFPTGAILPLARRLALLAWAKRAGAVVIEDDYDGEFHHEGQPVESMQGLDSEGRVIYVGTFSRTIFPALRIGYLVAPKSLAPALTAAKWLCDRHTATLEQETLADFIQAGVYDRHLRRARRANAIRRLVLRQAIREYFGNRVTLTGDGSGTHLVLWPKRLVSEDAIVARAQTKGVGVYGISEYFHQQPARPGLMLGYCGMAARDIPEGIRLLAGGPGSD